MSLFNDLQSGLIEKPKQTWSYKKIRLQKQQKEETKTEKQIRKEMKEKLPEKEYRKRYHHREYMKRTELYKQKYEEKKKKQTQELLDLINEIWPDEEEVDWDNYYKEKFECDDKIKKWYRFYRRASKLLRYWGFPEYKMPIRIHARYHIDKLIRMAMDSQHQAYQYIKPHMDEIKDCVCKMNKTQVPYDFPTYRSSEPLRSLADNAPLHKWYIFLVYEGMRRNKYMCSEMYLGRISFIFGDVIVTQTWNLFRISLDHNLPWLTKDTVEDIHKKRIEWRRDWTKEPPPIYVLRDAYLIKVKLKETFLYYIVPT